MRILVDADACPVNRIVEQVAEEYHLPLIFLCDDNHVLSSRYGDVVTVPSGMDAVDFKIIEIGRKGDIVVTQDYGVAAMVLGKGMFAIHQSGREYTEYNIDSLLMERHMSKKARKSGKHHGKGPSKRTAEDDLRFREELIRLIEKNPLV
ncbi:MAG: YaiI/YqxD family protein [Lachnospiraceae bacterium]|nr:YaiI/YqxD family protein [Lachnospiraceae bacterium]MDD3659514.1 YaiI/YqxD family protein [Lachnospiraceae bacterium]